MFELSRTLTAKFPAVGTFDYILAMEGTVYRHVKGRRTLRFEVDGHGYFLKTHTGVGWLEIFKNLLQLRLPVFGAKNEWLAIRRLEELHVDTMKIAGFGERGVPPAWLQSFLITDELVNTLSLEDFCRTWPQNPPPKVLKRALIDKVAYISRQLHTNGVNHRDYYLCHFLFSLETVTTPVIPSKVKLFLIDLHRVQIRSNTPRRWMVKDLSGLHFSSMDIGLTFRDRLRFIKAYRDRPLRQILAGERDFWQNVERKAQKLYRKGVRG